MARNVVVLEICIGSVYSVPVLTVGWLPSVVYRIEAWEVGVASYTWKGV